MFNNHPYVSQQALVEQFSGGSYRNSLAFNSALQLFRKERSRGARARAWSILRRAQAHLIDLNAIAGKLTVRNRHYVGIKPVEIQKIRGTMGRAKDFSTGFAPLRENLRDRWVGVALARYQGVQMPAVEVIQVGDAYFVVDGHHRISVARAFGEEAIDAKVTAWETSGALPWEKSKQSAGKRQATGKRRRGSFSGNLQSRIRALLLPYSASEHDSFDQLRFR